MEIPGYQNRMSNLTVGHFEKDIIDTLSLSIIPGTPIFLSENNRVHIQEHHPDAYMKYFDMIEEIISEPDYVGIAGVSAPSIEYIKTFQAGTEHVNVAVRATKRGVYFVRSMFIIENGRLCDYLKRGKLQPAKGKD